MKKGIFTISAGLLLLTSSCQFFSKSGSDLNIPEEVSQEQLQDQRYQYKKDIAYKEKFLHQEKTDSAVVTIFNVISYQIKDDTANIGEGYDYYILDIGVDNFTNQPFPVSSFTKSCHFTTSNPSYLFSNVGFALKMYFLQSDSAEIDLDYIKKFYLSTMPPKEFIRAKLFAYEVSKEEKEPLIFRYKVAGKEYAYTVREKQY